MRKSVAFISCLIITISVFCQVNTTPDQNLSSHFPLPKVDRRTELLSIVFRLAGNREYNQDNFKSYVKDIHDHFDQFKNHEVVSFARELYQNNGISFDAPMSIAIYLSQPPQLKPIRSFSDQIPEPRWGKENAEKFVSLLQQFYVDAKCEEFFSRQEKMYKMAQERFKIVYDALDISWYKEYYGSEPKGSLNVLVGLGNGACNYGPKIIHPDGGEDPYAVMGSWSFDPEGKPIFSPDGYLPTLIHEFNHSFVNQLVEGNAEKLEKSGQTIFEPLASVMSRQAYSSWRYMEQEALVRASVIMYMKKHDHGEKAWEKEITSQISNGFIWIDELVDLLGTYENSRDQYPTLESFMPRIITFYDELAKNKKALFDRCVQIKKITPFKNHARNVSPSLTGMEISFSKPLVGKGFSIWYGEKGEEHFPIVSDGLKYADNNTSLIIPLKLKPNTEYEFVLVGQHFRATDGYPLLDVQVSFKTKAK
ncbi:MAG: DUF4932 domain-containing protein [Bacteroidales bacterium]|nr:DUF4932 domain-containing protein [Bacteroidales bacterium]